jgi:hypothetical protein
MLAHRSIPLHTLQTAALTLPKTGIISADDDGAKNAWFLTKVMCYNVHLVLCFDVCGD